jgi:diguanylate cyclase (GGDEF)-like protein
MSNDPLDTGRTLLLVDDNEAYLRITRRLLEREGHTVVQAKSGREALEILRQQQVDLVLLDYMMPVMSGAEVVEELRTFNPDVQVILQTGYASEHPPREVMHKLDIQGYYDKSEGPEKLMLWVDAGLKAARSLQMINKSRRGLRYILEVTPELHRIQSLDDLLQGILLQMSGLLGAVSSFVAVLPEEAVEKTRPREFEGFLAMVQEETELVIRAGTGRFDGSDDLDGCLERSQQQLVRHALDRTEVQLGQQAAVLPLRVGDYTIGVIYLDRPAMRTEDLELLNVFANQASVAIQNTQLYQMATVDALTGVFVRGFFEQLMTRELRTAFRSSRPLGFVLLDVDNMKQINDTAGHLAGDRALKEVGQVMHSATRGTDVLGRYGGDEFSIALPDTSLEGAEVVADRLRRLLSERQVEGAGIQLPLQASIGVTELAPGEAEEGKKLRRVDQDYFQQVYVQLMADADDALYRAKQQPGTRVARGAGVRWP